MKKIISLFLLTVIALGMFAGCSSKAENDLGTIQEGKLIMSTNAEFPPYEMTDDQRQVVGIDADIAAAIAKKLGLELEIDNMDFDASLLAVQQGKSDIVLAGVTADEKRKKVMDFSDSYATGIQVIITKEGSDVTLENLGEKMIGTQKGTTSAIYCSDDYGTDHVTTYDSSITAIQALKNGQIDCVVVDSAPAKELVASNPGLKILDTEYTVEHYAIGFQKGNTKLQTAVNKALSELTEDGTIQKILDKYIKVD